MTVTELPTLVETDIRGRTTIPGGRQRYVLQQHADGAILLEPAEVVTRAELRYLTNTELQVRIAHLTAHPEELVKSTRRQSRKQ